MRHRAVTPCYDLDGPETSQQTNQFRLVVADQPILCELVGHQKRLQQPDPEPEQLLPEAPLPLEVLNLAQNGMTTRLALRAGRWCKDQCCCTFLLTNQPQKVGWSAGIALS